MVNLHEDDQQLFIRGAHRVDIREHSKAGLIQSDVGHGEWRGVNTGGTMVSTMYVLAYNSNDYPAMDLA